PAGGLPYTWQRFLPINRHGGMLLADPDQWSVRVSMAELLRLHFCRGGRPLVGLERHEAVVRIDASELGMSLRRLLLGDQRHHRQTRPARIDRSVYSFAGDRWRFWFHHRGHVGAAPERV